MSIRVQQHSAFSDALGSHATTPLCCTQMRSALRIGSHEGDDAHGRAHHVIERAAVH